MRPALYPVILGARNPLDAYGRAAFLFDTARSRYRNGSAEVRRFDDLPGLTFTRALAAYGQTSAGALTLFGSGVPRITDKGLLIEGARTNLCLQSQTFQNAVWDDGTPNNATVATDLTAPDGTATGQTLTAATGTTLSMRRQALTTVGSTSYIFSVFIKQGTATSSRIRVRDATNGVDVLQATAVTWSGGTPTIGGTTGTWGTPIQLAGGWWRIWGLATTGVGGVSCSIAIYPDNASGTGTLGVWQSDLQAGSFPSSPIPTTSASVTRPADVCSIAVSGLAYPLTLFAEFERVVDTGGSEDYFDIRATDNNNRTRIGVNGSDLAFVQVNQGGADQGSVTVAGSMAVATPYKMAARVNTNSIQIARGGTLGTEDTTATLPTTPNEVSLGQGNTPFGYISQAAIWSNLAFSDANLQGVTS